MPQRSGSSNSHLLEQAAAYLPPLLLILVAVSQVYLAGFGDLLTPAKGGGFGLFSTVDKTGNRDLRVYLIDDSGRESRWGTAELGRKAGRPVQRAMTFPTPRRLEVIARRAQALVDEPSIRALRVEVWKKGFDSNNSRVQRIKVASFVLTRDAQSD